MPSVIKIPPQSTEAIASCKVGVNDDKQMDRLTDNPKTPCPPIVHRLVEEDYTTQKI